MAACWLHHRIIAQHRVSEDEDQAAMLQNKVSMLKEFNIDTRGNVNVFSDDEAAMLQKGHGHRQVHDRDVADVTIGRDEKVGNEGWYVSDAGENCNVACEAAGLVCTEEQMLANLGDTHSDMQMRELLTALGNDNWADGTVKCNEVFYGNLGAVPWFVDHGDRQKRKCARPASGGDITSSNCGAKAGAQVDGNKAKRLCYCHPDGGVDWTSPTCTTKVSLRDYGKKGWDTKWVSYDGGVANAQACQARCQDHCDENPEAPCLKWFHMKRPDILGVHSADECWFQTQEDSPDSERLPMCDCWSRNSFHDAFRFTGHRKPITDLQNSIGASTSRMVLLQRANNDICGRKEVSKSSNAIQIKNTI